MPTKEPTPPPPTKRLRLIDHPDAEMFLILACRQRRARLIGNLRAEASYDDALQTLLDRIIKESVIPPPPTSPPPPKAR